MATSKNMPARFKSRMHFKMTALMSISSKAISMTHLIKLQDKAIHQGCYCGVIVNKTARSYNLARGKEFIIEARRYRKSVVLPRLP